MKLLTIESLKSNEFFMKNIRFDVTPEGIFKIRHVSTEEEKIQANNETQGFSFYIESMQKPYALVLMKTVSLTSKTVGEIIDPPQELLKAAIETEGAKDYRDCGMFPIDAAIEAWLRSQLGLQADFSG